MRKDIKFVQNQLMPFLKGMFKDAKESGKSFYKYFGTELPNKKTFKNSKELYEFKYGTNSLFENDKEAEKGFDVLIDELFARMQREYHFGTHKLYTPDENGEFSERQEKALFELSNSLVDKVNFKEKQPQEPPHDKIIKETSYRLGFGRLNIVEPLHFNEETGLIEGRVMNMNDPTGTYLNVRIDPVDPEMVYFEDNSGKTKFALNNTDKDLSLFQGKNSGSVSEAQTPKASSEPAATAAEPLSPQPSAKTEEFSLQLQGQKFDLKMEKTIEEETIEEGVPQDSEKLKLIAKQPRLPRVTEGEGLKTYEDRKLQERVTAQEQPKEQVPQGKEQERETQQAQKEPLQKLQEAEEGEGEEQNKKKKGSLGKKLAITALAGTGGVLGGITAFTVLA